MHLQIAKIKHQPYAMLDFQLEQSLFDPSTYGYDDFKLAMPITIKGRITNQCEGGFLVEGHFVTEVTLVCNRCLSDYQLAIQGDIKALYGSADGEGDGQIDAREYSGDQIDLTDLILSEISFLLPMQFLCKEDCLGLCPHCGIDLNNGTCDCADDTIDPRWAKLAEIRIKEEE